MEDKAEALALERIGTFNSEGREDVEHIKNEARNLVAAIEHLCPDGRRKSHALTQVETAAMYAVKSLFED